MKRLYLAILAQITHLSCMLQIRSEASLYAYETKPQTDVYEVGENDLQAFVLFPHDVLGWHSYFIKSNQSCASSGRVACFDDLQVDFLDRSAGDRGVRNMTRTHRPPSWV